MSTPDFTTMNQDQCVAWYIETVGYDPIKDDPSLSLEQLRRDCAEMYTYATCTIDAGGRSPEDPDFDPCCGVRVYGGDPLSEGGATGTDLEADTTPTPRPRMRM